MPGVGGVPGQTAAAVGAAGTAHHVASLAVTPTDVAMRVLTVLAALLLFGGCTNATIAEAVGRPDPFDWTYFDGSAEDVVDALVETFQATGVRIESVRTEDEAAILTLSSRLGSATFSEIRVERTEAEGFSARAQIYPDQDPLPRWLEQEVSGRI